MKYKNGRTAIAGHRLQVTENGYYNCESGDKVIVKEMTGQNTGPTCKPLQLYGKMIK